MLKGTRDLHEAMQDRWDEGGRAEFREMERRRNELRAQETARREALGPDGRRHEDYGRLWAQMVRGER